MKKLASIKPEKLLDLLTERLAFERNGVKLYDAILFKMEREDDPQIVGMLDQMIAHRDHENEHAAWLEGQIRKLGGDAHGETDGSRLVTIESSGIEQVIM